MPNVTPVKYDIAVTYRVDGEFIDAVKELRIIGAKGSSIPSQADVVRHAVMEKLDRERKAKKRA